MLRALLTLADPGREAFQYIEEREVGLGLAGVPVASPLGHHDAVAVYTFAEEMVDQVCLPRSSYAGDEAKAALTAQLLVVVGLQPLKLLLSAGDSLCVHDPVRTDNYHILLQTSDGNIAGSLLDTMLQDIIF